MPLAWISRWPTLSALAELGHSPMPSQAGSQTHASEAAGARTDRGLRPSAPAAAAGRPIPALRVGARGRVGVDSQGVRLRRRPRQVWRRRRSRVDGKSGFSSRHRRHPGPGVCPMAKNRARRRASASFEFTGNVLVAPPARMRHMVGAAADRRGPLQCRPGRRRAACAPESSDAGSAAAARRDSARRRRTRPSCPVGCSGSATAVAGHRMALADQPGHLHLQPLDRGIDVARRAARAGLLAEHVPGLDRLAQLDLDAVVGRRGRTSGKRNSRCGANHSAPNG